MTISTGLYDKTKENRSNKLFPKFDKMFNG